MFAGDIWVVDRAGGDARRLTAGVGLESYPVFSPDGEQIAFAGEYEGNLDVYVIPAVGGVPRRFTHHPDPDVPVGWIAGRQTDAVPLVAQQLRPLPAALHRSRRQAEQPTELPLPQAEDGSLSPDGKRIAYVPLSNKPQFPGPMRPLKNYRGGTSRRVDR